MKRPEGRHVGESLQVGMSGIVSDFLRLVGSERDRVGHSLNGCWIVPVLLSSTLTDSASRQVLPNQNSPEALERLVQTIKYAVTVSRYYRGL
jgi:hypothetical protein